MKTRLAVILVGILILPTIAMVMAFYMFARDIISAEVTDLLENTLEQKTTFFAQWLDDEENDVWTIATVYPLGQILLESGVLTDGGTTDPRLDDMLEKLRKSYRGCFTGFKIFDTTGFCVWPADQVDTLLPDQAVLPAITTEQTIFLNKTPDSGAGALAFWLCAPISDGEDGWIGVIAAVMDPDLIVELFSDASGSSSIKAYLLDSRKGAVTPLYNIVGPDSTRLPTSYAAERALAGYTGVGRYRDYRGKMVLGAYTYLPSPGWGLVIEQDYDEAFADLHTLRQNILLLLGGLAIVCTIIALFTANWLVGHLELRDRQVLERSEQMIAADKLATAGVMAASVAHEINNPLTTINILIHNLHEETPAIEPQRMDLSIALDEITKIKNIVLRFLEFARPQEPNFSEIDVNEVVRRYWRLVRHQAAAKDIDLVEKFGRELPLVPADPGQVGQAFLNILLNAIDATPVSGRIEIATTAEEENMVSISFFNSGPPLKSNEREKIFEPFYSTKAQGTGLGLSIARMIVERHGGKLYAEPCPGRGTKFTILLKTENQGADRG